MDISKLTSWKDIPIRMTLGFLGSVLVVSCLVWAVSDDFIITPAEAAEAHKIFAKWHLDDVRKNIEDTEVKKIETKYRSELPPQARDELMAKYDTQLKRLRKAESCLERGELRCE